MSKKMILNNNLDFIGDIHGHAESLVNLLEGMDYKLENGIYKHPSRKVFFIGDFIDRGPQIRQTLEIVKGMCDAGEAFAIMGNHEYNAVCFHTHDKDGKPLREHSHDNIKQHEKTLEEFEYASEEWEDYLNWFKTLPLYFENEYFRAVHACWEKSRIQELVMSSTFNLDSYEFLVNSSIKNTKNYDAVDEILKGKEVFLEGASFIDKDGKTRKHGRIKWWKSSENLKARDFIFEYPGLAPNFEINIKNDAYPAEDKSVFFGHYWLKANQPELMASNVCCLDYSVAKHGILCGYRWNGERLLNKESFVWVDAH